jgi:hypothetical protein
MLELAMTAFRYSQSPPIRFEHSNHVTYLHGSNTSHKGNQISGSALYIAHVNAILAV